MKGSGQSETLHSGRQCNGRAARPDQPVRGGPAAHCPGAFACRVATPLLLTLEMRSWDAGGPCPFALPTSVPAVAAG